MFIFVTLYFIEAVRLCIGILIIYYYDPNFYDFKTKYFGGRVKQFYDLNINKFNEKMKQPQKYYSCQKGKPDTRFAISRNNKRTIKKKR